MRALNATLETILAASVGGSFLVAPPKFKPDARLERQPFPVASPKPTPHARAHCPSVTIFFFFSFFFSFFEG